jgi:hypothetical protein
LYAAVLQIDDPVKPGKGLTAAESRKSRCTSDRKERKKAGEPCAAHRKKRKKAGEPFRGPPERTQKSR